MAFRIVRVGSRCKLETRLNYLVCYKEKETKILLDEISILIVESQQACLTNALLTELASHHIRVVFCDKKHQPYGEIQPYAGSQDSFRKLKKQLSWSREAKDGVWTEIVRKKIRNQRQLLQRHGKDEAAGLLSRYEREVGPGDDGNREGLAAKAYFPALFGPSFDRRNPTFQENDFLDYGYAILLAAVDREVAALGYLPQLGIHHVGETNPYNLGCDLMEPFRPFIDGYLAGQEVHKDGFKTYALSAFSQVVSCNGRKTVLDNAIPVFVDSAIQALQREDPALLADVRFQDEHL